MPAQGILLGRISSQRFLKCQPLLVFKSGYRSGVREMILMSLCVHAPNNEQVITFCKKVLSSMNFSIHDILIKMTIADMFYESEHVQPDEVVDILAPIYYMGNHSSVSALQMLSQMDPKIIKGMIPHIIGDLHHAASRYQGTKRSLPHFKAMPVYQLALALATLGTVEALDGIHQALQIAVEAQPQEHPGNRKIVEDIVRVLETIDYPKAIEAITAYKNS
jgi:hypothetical protein